MNIGKSGISAKFTCLQRLIFGFKLITNVISIVKYYDNFTLPDNFFSSAQEALLYSCWRLFIFWRDVANSNVCNLWGDRTNIWELGPMADADLTYNAAHSLL